MSAEGRGFPNDVARAEAYFQRGCQLRSGAGCTNAGLYASLPITQTGHFPNLRTALAYYQKACDLDYALGCSNLASLYENGRAVGRPDLVQAREYYDKSCRLGRELSCPERDRLNRAFVPRGFHIYIHH